MILKGVPLLYPQEVAEQIRFGRKRPRPRRAKVLTIAKSLGVENNAWLVDEIYHAYSEAMKIAPSPIGKVNEIACFFERFVEQHAHTSPQTERLFHKFTKRGRGLLSTIRPVRAMVARRDVLEVLVRFVRHHVPRRLEHKRTSVHNIRLKNVGDFTWRGGSGKDALRISYHWLDKEGRVVVHDGLRSYFPLDVRPGHEITVPVTIEANVASGEYSLNVALVQEDVRWFDDSTNSLLIPVEVVGHPVVSPDVNLITVRDVGAYEYAEEHEYARSLLLSYSVEFGSPLNARREPPVRLLEIGCGCSPQTSVFAQNVIGVGMDISYPLLQLGKALGTAWGHPLEFVAGDGERLPFDDSSFDISTCFATLHHFADPIGFLSEMRRVTKAGGMVASFCEPESSQLNAAQELEAGLNEQVFSMEEYLDFYRRAGLKIHCGELRGGSLHLTAS